ncbi:putative ribonuclease H-like domain-containing protein [Tanacetum coccineum]
MPTYHQTARSHKPASHQSESNLLLTTLSVHRNFAQPSQEPTITMSKKGNSPKRLGKDRRKGNTNGSFTRLVTLMSIVLVQRENKVDENLVASALPEDAKMKKGHAQAAVYRIFHCDRRRRPTRRVMTDDDKASYLLIKVNEEVKTDEPKALVSVDSMVNWSDHAAENKTDERMREVNLSNANQQVRALATSRDKPGDESHRFDNWCGRTDFAACRSAKAASVPAGSRNSSASVTADGSDPAASRNRPAVNSAGRPKPTERVGHPADIFRRTALYFNNMYWPELYDPMNKGRWGTAIKTSAGYSWRNKRPHFVGVLRVMVDLINPMVSQLNDPHGMPQSELAWVLSCTNVIVVKGGIVKFGGGDGRISGKGTIRTFKDDFKTQIPREHDLYTFSISELQPEQNVTCLVAKASLDESTRWHRRMAHVNFKTINKLRLRRVWLMGYLSRVSITNPHNKTPYELISGKVPQIGHLKPFGCQVTILNTSDYLGKFEGKADEGYLVGYAPNSKAYRVYNLTNKRVEETLNLRFLEDKPNDQGIGTYGTFDLDYLTDSLGYTRFKTNKPAGTQETNINAGTQDTDSDSEVDEQVIVVPSFPSNSFAGPSSSNGPSVMERNADYAEELAKLQRQEYEAKDAAARYGYFVPHKKTAEILSQAEAEIRNQGVSADRDPAGIASAGSDPAGGNPAGSSQPAGSDEPAGKGNPAVSTSVSADFIPVHADESTLPPGQPLGSSENTTRFPVPSDLEPTSIAKALEDPDWVAAMQEEMQQFINQQVWKTFPYTYGPHAIGTKMILKEHEGSRGIVVLIIARFMFCTWTQTRVGHRLLMRWMLRVPFSMEKLKKKCMSLSLKALKILSSQSMRAEWLKLYMDFIKHLELGMQDCLLFCYNTIIEEVYVDDIIFGSTNKAWCAEFEEFKHGEFEMSAMGEMTFFLGLQVKQLPDGTFISQDRYVKDMLTKFDMESVRTATTPYEAAKTKLKDETDPPVNVHLYRSMIGSLMYLTASRPDHNVCRNPLQVECQFLGKKVHLWLCKKADYCGYFFTEADICMLLACAQVLKIHTDDNVADLLTKAIDGPRFEYLSGSTIFCRSYSSCWMLCSCWIAIGLCFGIRVQAGRQYFSVGKFIAADRVFVYAVNTSFYAAELVCAGSIMFLLAELFLLVVSIPAGVSMYLLNE